MRPLRVRTSDPRARAPGSGRRRQLGGALPASGPGGQTPVLGTHVKPHSSVRGVHCRTGAGVPAPQVASGSWSPRCAFTGRWRLPGRRLRVWSGTRGAHGHTSRSASRCDEGPWSDLTPSGCCVGGSGACGEEQTLQPGPEPAGDPPARRRGAQRGVLGPGGRRGPGSRHQAPSRRRGLSAPPRPPAPASVSTRRCPPTLRVPASGQPAVRARAAAPPRRAPPAASALPCCASSGAPVAAVAAVTVVLGGDARVQAGGGLSSSGPARAQVPRAAPSPPRCGSAPPDDSRETSTRLALDVLRPRASFLWHRGACREQPFRCKFKLIYLPSVRLTGFCI